MKEYGLGFILVFFTALAFAGFGWAPAAVGIIGTISVLVNAFVAWAIFYYDDTNSVTAHAIADVVIRGGIATALIVGGFTVAAVIVAIDAFISATLI